MHSESTLARVRELVARGLTTRDVSLLTGVPPGTIRHWRQGDRRARGPTHHCFRCRGDAVPDVYPYVLGAYLGDGHISTGRRGVQALTISCDDKWPGVKQAATEALGLLLDTSVCHVQAPGCTIVKAYSKHWGCLFPQHGPGRKHDRRIVLEPWQLEIVDASPALFLRGLFHSDGCRITNWTVRTVGGEPKRYEYPRWFFDNESADILDLCAASLVRLGIAHRRPRRNAISVARRDAVASMDRLIGPKT